MTSLREATKLDAGTIVRLPDGREGTIVYQGLDGAGIKWGRHEVDKALLVDVSGNPAKVPDDFDWYPDALLREPFRGADLECVGTSFEIIETETGNE